MRKEPTMTPPVGQDREQVARRGRPGYDQESLLMVCVGVFNEHGFDATQAHPREILRFIERNPEYQYLKTTSGRIA